MTTLAMTLPVARRSPLYVPRRDLVLIGGDALTLGMTLVASDNPDAAVVDLLGIGPQVSMLIWSTPMWECWDYGLGFLTQRATECVEIATISTTVPGLATVVLPSCALSGFRCSRRVGFTVQLSLGGDLGTIAWGALELLPGAALAQPGLDLLDDSGLNITSDSGQDIALINNCGTSSATTLASLTQLLVSLPTTLPATPGILWNNGGVICVS